jgi:signal transduction histidine kinase
MNGRHDLSGEYAAALRSYVSAKTELDLARAHELGREALSHRLGVLEVAALHFSALNEALTGPLGDEQRASILDAAGQFFIEILAPFEMAHQGAWNTSATLPRLDQILEAQARRIASVLHDDAGQLLTSVHLALADMARRVPSDHRQEIQAVRALLDQIEARLRDLAHEIRPPVLDDLGLMPALQFLAESVSRRWGVSVGVEVDTPRKIPATVETSLYRITQEALTNTGRHARATRADVSIRQTPTQIVCSIRDDGIGLDATARGAKPPRGLGLREIEARVAGLGGVLSLGANVPSGTALIVEIPLER